MTQGNSRNSTGPSGDPMWSLESAKARFSEVVRKARSSGPQHVTVRGQQSVVVVSAEEFARLTSAPPEKALVSFLEELGLDEVVIARDEDHGRDLDL